MVVFDQVGIPLVRFGAEEAIVAIEALLQWPLLAARARRDVRLGDEMALTQPEGAPSPILQDLAHRGALVRDATMPTRKARRRFRDRGHAVQVMITAGQERGARRRAQRRRVPLRIHQAVVSQLLQSRHVDLAAEGRPGSQARIIVQNQQDVWRASGRPHRDVRLPVRRRIPDIELDDALKRFVGHCCLPHCALKLRRSRPTPSRTASLFMRLARRWQSAP